MSSEFPLPEVPDSQDERLSAASESAKLSNMTDVSASTQLHCRNLRGHKMGVTTVDSSHVDEYTIASGSDDKTVRIWDLRTNRAHKCIHQCFPDSVEQVLFSPKVDYELYAACGSRIFLFDLRMEAVVQREASRAINMTADSINHIAIHPKGTHIAAADDEGCITVLDLTSYASETCRRRVLSRGHTNIAGCLAFKPNSLRELASGGFDCKVCFWDTSMGRPQGEHSFSQVFNTSTDGESLSRAINPPFVHDVGYVAEGAALACVLGDGSLRVLSSETYGLLSEIDAHGGMATALFIDRYRSNCVLTGGVDGKLKVWNLDLSQSVLSGPRKGKARKASCGAKKRAEMRAEVSLHFELNHGTKINSICISRKGETSSGIWAVADVTNVISLYSP